MDESTEKLIINEKAVRLNQQALRSILIGDQTEAIIQFNNAIKMDNNFSEPYFHLGNIYIKEDNFELASKMYNEAIKLATDNPNLYLIDPENNSLKTIPNDLLLYKSIGHSLGFKHVESGPLVRSSYHAEKHIL